MIKFGFYILGVMNCPFLTVLCITGYKFTSNLMAYFVFLIGGSIAFWIAILFNGLSMLIFVVKSLKRFTHHNTMANSIGDVS